MPSEASQHSPAIPGRRFVYNHVDGSGDLNCNLKVFGLMDSL